MTKDQPFIPERGLGEPLLQQVVERMTEDDFHRVFYAGLAKFGYSGTYFQRGDLCHTDDNGDWTDEISEELWAKVRDSHEWSRGLADHMTEKGNEYIADWVVPIMLGKESW